MKRFAEYANFQKTKPSLQDLKRDT